MEIKVKSSSLKQVLWMAHYVLLYDYNSGLLRPHYYYYNSGLISSYKLVSLVSYKPTEFL